MELSLWKAGQVKRIYVNGIQDFSGKCYFFQKKGHAVLQVTGDDLSLEKKDSIYQHIELNLQLDRGNIVFKDLCQKVEAISGESKKKEKPKKKNFFNKSYGEEVHDNKEHAAENLDLLSIDVPAVVKIEVDDREPKEMIDLLSLHPMVVVDVKRLTLGDYILCNTIVVERKDCDKKNRQATDFETSTKGDDKRFYNQSERLKLQDEHIPIILLEGDCYKKSHSMLVQSIDGMISFLAVIQKISIWSTYNINHTAYTLIKLATHFQNGLGYPISLRASKPTALIDRKSFILEGITGVSTLIAQSLLKTFGSVKGVAQASRKDLEKVHKVGPILSKKIYESLS